MAESFLEYCTKKVLEYIETEQEAQYDDDQGGEGGEGLAQSWSKPVDEPNSWPVQPAAYFPT